MKQLWTLVLLFSCDFELFSVNANSCSNFRFSRQLDRRLRCFVYKRLAMVNVIECHEKCVSELSCFSVNFYQNEVGTNVCELIKGTTSSLRGQYCFEWKERSEYDELLETGSCSSSFSCKAGKLRKALPGNWYQLGSSAFKLFEKKKNNTEATAVCSANGAALATINSDDENKFIAELFLEESKRDVFITDILKPFKRWKLDGSDQDVALHGSLVAKKDEYNSFAALYFTGTTGSYATSPAWGINAKTFSISLWVKLENIPPSSYLFYSYWSNPYIFVVGVTSSGKLSFQGRKKSNQHSDLFSVASGKVALNKWTHVVHVWNRETKQATGYQDGSKIYQTTPLTTTEIDLPAPIRSVFDVGYKRDSKGVMKGWLRELLVFDRAVTEEEVNTIQDATVLDPRVWIGAPQSYLNMAPVSQPNTNCFSARTWGTYQWDKVPCDRTLRFVCKKTI